MVATPDRHCSAIRRIIRSPPVGLVRPPNLVKSTITQWTDCVDLISGMLVPSGRENIPGGDILVEMRRVDLDG